MRRKNRPDNTLQLSLWSDEQPQGKARQEAQIPGESHADVRPGSLDTPQELDLTLFSRETLTFHGPHDEARRSWLRSWAEEQGYKKYNFTLHGRYSGYYKTAVGEGPERWDGFLSNAVQFDVYCCYISACASQPLSFYLEDAVKRSEIPEWELNDKLLWKPSDHSRLRGS
jgi:hypothetical protein